MSTIASLVRILACFFQLAVEAVRAFAHPEDVENWRSAWVYFWFPVSYFTIFGIFVTWLLFRVIPWPADWIIGLPWIVYIWIGEPMMWYVEGNGFQKAEHYIKTGEWLPWKWREQ